jgi:hypothetical protein
MYYILIKKDSGSQNWLGHSNNEPMKLEKYVKNTYLILVTLKVSQISAYNTNFINVNI